MPLLDKIRADKLIALAHQHYDPNPTDAEIRILQESTTPGPFNEPDNPENRAEIRSSFLRWLVTDPEVAPLIDPAGLHVSFVNITGNLNLSKCHFPFGITFVACVFGGDIDLREIDCGSINFFQSATSHLLDLSNANIRGSLRFNNFDTNGVLASDNNASAVIDLGRVQLSGGLTLHGVTIHDPSHGINLDDAAIKGFVSLGNNFSSHGDISMEGAQFGSDVSFTDAAIHSSETSVDLSFATIQGSLHFSQGFSVSGSIELYKVQIGGSLTLTEMDLPALKESVDLSDAVVKSHVYLGPKLRSGGKLGLENVHIGGDLSIDDVQLNGAPEALNLSNAVVKGTFVVRSNFRVKGTIFAPKIQIGGNALFDESEILAAADPDPAMNISFGIINGSLSLDKCSVSQGWVAASDVQIGGDLSFSGANIRGTDTALTLDGANIKGSISFTDGFVATGNIYMAGAQVSGNLDCSGAEIRNKGTALTLDGANIKGNISLTDGFHPEGSISLLGAQVGGDIECYGGKISSLDCSKMRQDGELIWIGIHDPASASLKLAGATIKNLHDSLDTWPPTGNLRIDGFVYQDLILHQPATADQIKAHTLPPLPTPTPSLEKRVDWIMRQPVPDQTNPQPWLQLAKVLEARGDMEASKRVHYAFSRRQAQSVGFLRRDLGLIYDWIEEDPLKVLWPILLLWLFGSLIFWRARRMRAMAPTDKTAYELFTQSGDIPANYIPFSPAVYTLETVLPVVKFGQAGAWAPDPCAKPSNWFPTHPRLAWTRWFPGNNFLWLEFFRRLLILLGWALALILAGAIGSRFKS